MNFQKVGVLNHVGSVFGPAKDQPFKHAIMQVDYWSAAFRIPEGTPVYMGEFPQEVLTAIRELRMEAWGTVMLERKRQLSYSEDFFEHGQHKKRADHALSIVQSLNFFFESSDTAEQDWMERREATS